MIIAGWFWVLGVTLTSVSASNEFFTAATDIELLHKLEHRLSLKFLDYVEAEEKRLDDLQDFISSLEGSVNQRKASDEKAGHPTDGLKLLKRYNKHWPEIQKFSKTNTSRTEMLTIFTDLTKFKEVFPSDEDLKGAVEALYRLQDTYRIPAKDMADGLSSHAQPLIIEEVFEMGFLAMGMKDFYHAEMWFKEAYRRFPSGARQVSFLEKVNLLEYLAWSEYHTGKLEDAIKHTKEILKLVPTDAAAKTNLEVFEEDLEKAKVDPTIRKIPKKNDGKKWLLRHNKQCRGQEKVPQDVFDRLYCEYVQTPARFLLKPLKREKSFERPDLFVYHDFLRDHEIDRIITVARPLLNRATVHCPVTGKLVYADYRVSKSAWLYEEMDEVAAKVIAKVGDATGLNMRYAEALQVANYGLGGQYQPHFDHSTKEKKKVFKNYGGNRIATMLMYLSDVEAGGKTVFTNTRSGAVTSPVKGDAVFWYNLKRNGGSDSLTRHAGCPVLIGQKWVSNLWIHEHGQEFRRPCTLDKNE